MTRAASLLIGLACLGAAGVALYGATSTQDQPIQPGLFPDEPVRDFGELEQGDVRAGQFQLTNRHREPIEVINVLTGCSCTESTLSAKQVPPDCMITLDIKWSVGTRRGRLADVVLVMYRTSAGATHMIELRLTAQVTPDIHYAPDVLTFEPDKPSTVSVRFTPGRRNPFVIQQAIANQAAFRVTFDATRSGVVVTFDPSKWVDIGADPALVVTTDSTRQPMIVISLHVLRNPRSIKSTSHGSTSSTIEKGF